MLRLRSLTRVSAAAIHLGLSAAIGVAVLACMLLVWYPPPYFEAAGGKGLILLLLGVDVVLGPLLTFVVFNPAKKSLPFDLAVIAGLQVAALVYGMHVMFAARPVYSVFNVDRFTLVTASQIDDAAFSKAPPAFRRLPATGPQVIAARLPTDPAKRRELTDLALAGIDLPQLPEYYLPYADEASAAAARARPVAELERKFPDARAAIAKLAQQTGVAADAMGQLPFRGRDRDLTVIVDRRSGAVLAMLPYDPW
jgi:hypothetical protein